jgi:hypothetical protein
MSVVSFWKLKASMEALRCAASKSWRVSRSHEQRELQYILFSWQESDGIVFGGVELHELKRTEVHAPHSWCTFYGLLCRISGIASLDRSREAVIG